jgi:pyridoxine 4-dehydrogenase
LGFIPWFPVASGKLARARTPLDETARRQDPLDEIAGRHGITVAQLSIAWLLHRSPVMMPIPGTSSVKHLEENVAAAGVHLDEREWAELERRLPRTPEQ